MSLGAGVIGDIYELEERGTAFGIFTGVRHCCWDEFVHNTKG